MANGIRAAGLTGPLATAPGAADGDAAAGRASADIPAPITAAPTAAPATVLTILVFGAAAFRIAPPMVGFWTALGALFGATDRTAPAGNKLLRVERSNAAPPSDDVRLTAFIGFAAALAGGGNLSCGLTVALADLSGGDDGRTGAATRATGRETGGDLAAALTTGAARRLDSAGGAASACNTALSRKTDVQPNKATRDMTSLFEQQSSIFSDKPSANTDDRQ